MPVTIRFFVRGEPKPKGSLSIMPRRGRVPLEQDGVKYWALPDLCLVPSVAGASAWQRTVEREARKHAPPVPLVGAVSLRLTFWLPRPASVDRVWPSVAPDGDKLVRAVRDALTKAGVYLDDGQVVAGSESKRYADAGNPPGVLVEVEALEPQQLRLPAAAAAQNGTTPRRAAHG